VPVALAGAVGVARPEDHADDGDEVGDGDEEAGAEDREAETADDERRPEADGVESGGGAEVGKREARTFGSARARQALWLRGSLKLDCSC